MTILFDATRQVKPATRQSFGRGILPARRMRFVPSPEDLQWNAENSPNNRDGYDVIDRAPTDAELEERAEQARWDDLADRGCFPM